MTVSLGVDIFHQALTKAWPSIDSRSEETRAMAGRSSEIEQAYRDYGGLVFRRCLQLLKTEAEAMDATQDVFVRVVRSIGQFRGQSSKATWLYRIATNTCLNRIRDKGNRERLTKEALEPIESARPVEEWSRDLIVRLLALFDRTTQEVVIYSIVEGMNYDEISEVMGCSVGRVRKCMTGFNATAHKRALKLLEEHR